MREVTAVITQEPAKISCNFEQVREAIQETLEEYRGAVFTEDSKTMAKKHVASLRAQKKTLQDNLRIAEKKYMVPWNEIKAQANELIGMYDEPINLINGQVQAFEEKRIAEKKELISTVYGELIPRNLTEYIPLARIYNPKWENATFKERDIRAEISDTADKIRKEVSAISEMESDAVPRALEMYREVLDLNQAVSYISSYERQKQEILAKEQERRRREDEEKIRREERDRMLAEQRARETQEAIIRQADMEKQEALRRAEEEKAEALRQAEAEKAAAVEQAKVEAAQEVIDSFIPEDKGDEVQLYEFRIFSTAKAKESVCMFMDSIGVEWEVI